jgi:putrescine aminotransferase
MTYEGKRRHPTIEKYARHVNPGFIKLLGVFGYGRVFTRALDVHVWDSEERRYVDFLANFGAANLGHNHPRLVKRMRDFLSEEAPNLMHVGPSPWEADLAERLAELLPDPLEVCLFASSGSEAVEAGMKLARAVTGRPGFVYCKGGFHGTNLGPLSLMGEARLRAPFEPLLAGCVPVEFGDLDQLEKELRSKQAAAFILEPIQCEGGVILPPHAYLKNAQELCTRYGSLLILDEVQTGMGRCGSLFAFRQEDFVPDVLLLGKSFSGGMIPMSAAITSSAWMKKAYGSADRFDLHSSTFKGNALGCVAAMETLDLLTETSQGETLVTMAARTGELLRKLLEDRLGAHPLVRQVRGRGALVGVELGSTDAGLLNKIAPFLVDAVSQQVFGQWVSYRLLEEGFICQPASHRWNVIRFEPPFTATKQHVEQMVEALVGILEEYPGIGPLLRDAGKKVGSQLFTGWSFG